MVLSPAHGVRSVALPSPSSGSAVPVRGEVADQLDALLGEHLLPLRARRPGHDDPHLLAVDASGQPVVVEVVGLLGGDACLAALRHAGRASRMSADDLAAAYSAGPHLFRSHLEAFRSTVPATALLSRAGRSGARLLLVCSEVDPSVEDVVDFLLQKGREIEVLRVRVRSGPGGSRVVDVVPVEGSRPSRDALPATIPSVRRSRDRDPADVPERPTPTIVPPPFATAVRGVPSRPASAAPAPAPAPAPRPGPRPAPAPAPAPEGERPGPRWTSTGASRPAQPGATRPAQKGGVSTPFVDPRLESLAPRFGEPVVLVWPREHRGEYHEAVLHTDGTMELPDGSRYGDPDGAAWAAGGAAVDGWRVWRVEDEEGPTLAELV